MSIQLNVRQRMFAASMIGDSHALGTHWIYKLDRVEALFSPELGLQEPAPDTFHPGKHRGDQTHYGDQALMLFQFLHANEGEYDGIEFSRFWLDQMKSYRGYEDTATRESINLLTNGNRYGYLSDELGGAARMVSTLYWIKDPVEAVDASLDQARLTHRSPRALLVADLFARSAVRMLQGDTRSIIDILRSVRDERAAQILAGDPEDLLVAMRASIQFFDLSLENALKYVDGSPREIASGLGQTCHAHHALPVILNILAKEVDYRERCGSTR